MTRPKGKFQTDEARREYQRRYYQIHKEKAKEYQRLYNLAHKKKAKGKGKRNFVCPRPAVREAFTYSDLMKSHDDQLAKMFSQIISGERMLVT